MQKLKMTPLVIQALTAPGARKGTDYSTLSDLGKEILEKMLGEILEKEHGIQEYVWYFINISLSNKNLADTFDCLEKKYAFRVTIPASNKFNHGLTERMKARIVYALIFAVHNDDDTTENKTLLDECMICLKKYITIEKTAYLTIYKMIQNDNIHAVTPVNIKKLFKTEKVGDVYIASFTYAGVTAEATGISKNEAREAACKGWLAKDRKNE
jgi:hypothetical protein